MTNNKVGAAISVSGLLLIVAASCGCGGRKFPITPTTGKITFEGNPIAGGGRVRFIPLDTQGDSLQGKAAMGELGPDGTFQLTTYEPGDGAIVGEHRVEVVQNDVLEPAEYAQEAAPGRGGAIPTPDLIRPARLVPPAERIPAVYGGPESPLRATVEVDGETLHIEVQRLE